MQVYRAHQAGAHYFAEAQANKVNKVRGLMRFSFYVCASFLLLGIHYWWVNEETLQVGQG